MAPPIKYSELNNPVAITRRTLELSQRDFGTLLAKLHNRATVRALKIPKGAICDYETGRRETPDYIVKLCKLALKKHQAFPQT